MSRSKQLYFFNQVYPYIPFHVKLQAKPIQLKLFWRNIDKNGAFWSSRYFFMLFICGRIESRRQKLSYEATRFFIAEKFLRFCLFSAKKYRLTEICYQCTSSFHICMRLFQFARGRNDHFLF
jgi:hypothetical protein